MNASPFPGADPVTLETLAAEPCWVAWQAEGRGNDVTKVPYIDVGRKAQANRGPWLTRADAEKVAAELPKPHRTGGVGIEFFASDDGRALGGVDLDACRDPASGAIEGWALAIIEGLDSYTEISPSGTGAKVFLTYVDAELARLQDSMATKWGKQFKRGAGKHPPAIELHLGNRYFAVTDQILSGMPHEFRLINVETLLDIIQRIGPEFAGKVDSKGGKAEADSPGADNPPPDYDAANPELLERIKTSCGLKSWLAKRWAGDWSGIKDQSGSGRAFALGRALKRAGFSFEDMAAALHLHRDTREWAASKGDANQQRELHRIWDKQDAPRTPEGGRASWRTLMLCDDQGEPMPVLASAATALREAPELAGAFAYDEMLRHALVIRTLPDSRTPPVTEPRPAQDSDVAATQEWLQRHGLERLGKDVVHQAVDLVAREHAFHPVRDYLEALRWDRVPRIKTWLSSYLGADPTPYTGAIGRWFLIGMAARIMRPGCKCDYMMVLEGPQGARKSAACAILGGRWFSDNLPDVTGGKDVAAHLNGKWLIEVAEMSALSKAEAHALKAFITRDTERYRPPYGREEIIAPRQCVFIGTTNKAAYLRDETGGRRFWPVRVGKIDTESLTRDRDQLFAEAMVEFLKGERWWPDDEFERTHIAPEQEARYEADPWEGTVAGWLAARVAEAAEAAKLARGRTWTPEAKAVAEGAEKANRVTTLRTARESLFIETPRLGTTETRRIVAIMERLGWERKRDADGRWWEPPKAHE
jgi:hypothetical protein